MYTQLEAVVPLGYGLTPHITMAYFKPGVYTQDDVRGLREVLRPVEWSVELQAADLVYQEFCDMDHSGI